jgi:beta-lactam-binding protein with PASTA domain
VADEGLLINVIGTRPANPACPQPNKISEQDPASGTEVERGSVVRVWTNAAAPSPSPS